MVGGIDSVEAIGHTEQEVMDWFRQQAYLDVDNSMLGYFYRCMEEGSEFYYVYDVATGWRCGGVTWDTPLRGHLVGLDEAREAMEGWLEDLKYQVNGKGK
jgi:hypothetical protein